MSTLATSSKTSRTVLVTGASTGIGYVTAARFVAQGHRVFGTSRGSGGTGPDGVSMLPLDVRDGASVEACVAEVERRTGGIDVLVSNAGQMVFGPIEEVPIEDARAMFETNFWGAARVVLATLPGMRARRRGHVLLVGSVAATVAIPLNGYYAASKAALERYTEALRHEVAHFGVRVSLIEPSDHKTRFWASAQIASARLADYDSVRAPVMAVVQRFRDAAPEPGPVADAIVAAASDPSPAGVYRVGDWAKRLPRMRAWLPAGVFEAGMRRRFGLMRI